MEKEDISKFVSNLNYNQIFTLFGYQYKTDKENIIVYYHGANSFIVYIDSKLKGYTCINPLNYEVTGKFDLFVTLVENYTDSYIDKLFDAIDPVNELILKNSLDKEIALKYYFNLYSIDNREDNIIEGISQYFNKHPFKDRVFVNPVNKRIAFPLYRGDKIVNFIDFQFTNKPLLRFDHGYGHWHTNSINPGPPEQVVLTTNPIHIFSHFSVSDWENIQGIVFNPAMDFVSFIELLKWISDEKSGDIPLYFLYDQSLGSAGDEAMSILKFLAYYILFKYSYQVETSVFDNTLKIMVVSKKDNKVMDHFIKFKNSFNDFLDKSHIQDGGVCKEVLQVQEEFNELDQLTIPILKIPMKSSVVVLFAEFLIDYFMLSKKMKLVNTSVDFLLQEKEESFFDPSENPYQ